jgi:hypothetical protein
MGRAGVSAARGFLTLRNMPYTSPCIWLLRARFNTGADTLCTSSDQTGRHVDGLRAEDWLV